MIDWRGPWRTALTVAVLAGAIGILQVHGIRFWCSQVGPLGWAWSVLLEAVALWLWWTPKWTKRALGLLASLLLLVGPLYEVASPLLVDGAQARAQAEVVADLRNQIHELDTAQAAFLANSRSRLGWAGRIDATTARLAQLRTQLRSDLVHSPDARPWQRDAVIALECIALVLYQVTAVFAITALSKGQTSPSAVVAREHPSEDRSMRQMTSPAPLEQERRADIPEPAVTELSDLVRSVDAAIADSGQSVRAWTANHGIDRRELSRLRSFVSGNSDRSPAPAFLQRVADALSRDSS